MSSRTAAPPKKRAVCTLATKESWKDLQIFLKSLRLFEPTIPVYIVCDTEIKKLVAGVAGVFARPALDGYGQVSRPHMERTAGKHYKTRWEDFMMEKATVLDWAFTAGAESVFFCDSDICFFGPLPPVLGETTKLAVSPHMIRPADEAKYGRYNAGFVWTSDPAMPAVWRDEATRSRYYDQAALEGVVAHYVPEEVELFGAQVNYGWWRMYQGSLPAAQLKGAWSLFRGDGTMGIRVGGKPLLSIHTHFKDPSADFITQEFNMFVRDELRKLGKYEPAASFLRFLERV